jgi:hypothetical protein
MNVHVSVTHSNCTAKIHATFTDINRHVSVTVTAQQRYETMSIPQYHPKIFYVIAKNIDMLHKVVLNMNATHSPHKLTYIHIFKYTKSHNNKH